MRAEKKRGLGSLDTATDLPDIPMREANLHDMPQLGLGRVVQKYFAIHRSSKAGSCMKIGSQSPVGDGVASVYFCVAGLQLARKHPHQENFVGRLVDNMLRMARVEDTPAWPLVRTLLARNISSEC